MFVDASESCRDKKSLKKMDSRDISGQEWGNNEEYTDEGIKLEPFNMDQELEEG